MAQTSENWFTSTSTWRRIAAWVLAVGGALFLLFLLMNMQLFDGTTP